ncbi:RNA 2',3'-cyclic phosphodiesterase [Pseudomonas sp.]|uniref:RNA 2',3'-cyclic phosphodiesterase n=1 Tax=Pseudomonas sp. TaxID=306 RepID=UPI003C74819B
MIQDLRPSGSPFKRLFFALPVSDAQRRALAQWRRSLNLRSGKPVPAANFHVTLLFLGDVDAAQVPAICAAVDQLALPAVALRLALDRLQVWQRASALVLEPQHTPPALLQLVYALQQALLPLGVAVANREYRPHLTLSRDYRGQPPEASSAPEFYLGARHFTLYESRKGAYWPLAQWPLLG